MIEEDNIKHIINLGNTEQTMCGDTDRHSVSWNLSLQFPKLSRFASPFGSAFCIDDHERTKKNKRCVLGGGRKAVLSC